MQVALKPHPDTPASAVSGVAVDVRREAAGELVLRYVVTGAIGEIMLPPLAAHARADELWRHTCFEAFVQEGAAPGYCEFNFATSRQWAAYRFDGYRDRMSPIGAIVAPRIESRASEGRLEVDVSLDLAGVIVADADWRLALSVVIEEASGHKSYWALAHPQGKPDFHHGDGFVLDLPVEQT